jgi:hypothetical protein
VLKSVTDQQQKLAERAKLAATGLEALGGPAKLTTDQLNQLNATIQKGLDAFRALGQDVPPQLQKVAAAVQAQQQALSTATEKSSAFSGILGDLGSKFAALAGPAAIGFAIKQTLDYADTLTKMSDRTGIGVVALQKLEAIAKPSGNSIEDLAGSINKFQKNLADGDQAAAGAIQRIGLSVSALRELAPDEQFIAIAKGIQTIKDPAEQTLVAMQLFGRGGAEILPSLKAKVDELKDSTVTMSKESVEALDAVGDAFVRLKTSSFNVLGSMIAQLINAKKEFANLPKGFGNENIGGAQFLDQLNPIEPTKPIGADQFAGPLARIPTVAAGATAAITSVTQALAAQEAIAARLGLSLEDYQKQLSEVQAKIRLATSDTAQLTQAQAAQAAGLAAIGLSEQEIGIVLGRTSRAVHDYFDAVKSGANAEVAFLRQLDAQNKLEVDAENATIKLALAIQEHLLPNTVALKDNLAGVGTQLVFFGGENEATAVHLQKTLAGLDQLGTKLFASNSAIKQGHDGYAEWRTDLNELSKSLSQLAVISGGTFGGIVKDLAQVVAAVNVAVTSFDQFQKATTALGKITSGLSFGVGLLSLGETAFNFIKNIGGPSKDEQNARSEQQTFLSSLRNQLGPAARGLSDYDVLLQTVGKSMGRLGKSGEDTRKVLAGLLDTRNSKDFEAALATAQGFLDKAADIKNQVTGNIFSGLSAFSSNATVTSQGSASALTGALGAGITALQQQGTPLTEILKQVGPIVTNLQAQFDKAGFSGGAAFDLIQREVAVASDAISGPAITAVNGLGDVLKGLSNIGQLTQEEFTGLGDQAADTFNSLIAQGKDGDAALRLMQPTLQTLYELQQQFGFKVDESTQALIDQGIQNGIVGEKMKSVQQKTLDVLTAIAKALGATLPEEAEKGAQGIKDAFSKLHIDPVHVPIVVDHPEIQVPVPFDPYQPNGAATGGVVMPWGIQRFGGGGRVLPFLARGTDTVPAMLTPGEIVLNAAQQQRLAGNIGGVTIHNSFHSVFPASPTQMKRTLDEYVGPYMTDAVHRDVSGIRKVIKKVAAA